MLAVSIMFIIISCISIFSVAVFKKRFEETVPLSFFFIIILLYFFGIVGHLNIGVLFVVFISIVSLLFSITKALYKREFAKLINNFFTPAFLIFSILNIVLFLLNYHRLASSWDEFSHWADIVKVMYTLDDFGTNPISQSAFQSYPPAVSLFQYFSLKISQGYNEWMMYYSYQLFALSLFLPFLTNLRFKKILKNSFIFVLIIITPMIFFNSFYSIIYVDAFLGLFFAFIVSYIYALKKIDGFGTLTIVMAIFVLTLTKDAALFFALVSALLFTLKLTIFNYESISLLHKITGRRLITSALSFFSILIAKVSWSHKLSSNDISNNFSGKIDIKEFLSILVDKGLNYRNTDTYRKDVLDSFVDALISPSFQLGSFAMSTVQILVLIAVLFYIVFLLSIKSSNSTSQKKDFILIIIYYSSFLVYIFGLLASYMYKFSEYEAIRVASFNRYISIICAAGLAFVIFLAIKIFLSEDSDSISVPVSLVLSIILIIAPRIILL